MLHPGSYAAIEIMRKGVSFEELGALRDQVETLARICGKANDKVFVDDCFANMAGQEDIIDEMSAAVGLKRAGADMSLINLTGNFRALTAYMKEATSDGINAYLGKMDFDRLTVFFLRASDTIAGQWPAESAFVRSVARKQAAKLVGATTGMVLKKYDVNFMSSEEQQEKLLAGFLNGDSPKFPDVLRKYLNKASHDTDAMLKEIRNRFASDQPLFCKKSVESDFIPVARDEILGMLARDSMYGYVAQGLRRHGLEGFLERAEYCDVALREMRFSTNRRHSVMARLAAGEGDLDLRLLAYIDKNDPFTYRVDPLNDSLLKQRSLAMKAVRAHMPAIGFNEIREIVSGNDILSVAAFAGDDLPMATWCMLGRGMVADRLYGDRDDNAVFEAVERMKAIKPGQPVPVP